MLAADGWRPTPIQHWVLQSTAYEALHGGGKGSGKSEGLVAAPLRFVDNQNFRGLLLRREWTQAQATLLATAKKIYPLLGGRWYAQRKVWRFPSGAEIEINGCDHPSSVERYFGRPELSFLGIDQLEHFTREMYLALISCVRSVEGLPLWIRASANPGSIGHDWIVERFGPWVHPREEEPWHDPDYRGDYADSGEVRWYRTTAGQHGEEESCSRDAHEEDCDADPPCAQGKPCVVHAPRSRVYFHATVEDNPYYKGTEYQASLRGLDPVDRARYEQGNWMVRAKPGIYFSRSTIPIADERPPGQVIARVRYFDRAGTEAKKAKGKGAWTAGARMSITDTGLFVVEDMTRGQWGPGEVDQAILTSARMDPPSTVLALERDPGQAGRHQAYYDARMLAGHEFFLPPPVADKLTRMKPLSSQAREGNVILMRGAWNEALLRELEACPSSLWDQIDSLSGAMILLLRLQQRWLEHRRATAGQQHQPSRSGRVDRAALGPLRSGGV